MAYFAVTRQRGPAWNASRLLEEQEKWPEHASFMEALAADGFVVLGGPLGDGENVLLIIDAEGADAIHARLAADPWTSMDLLRVAKVEPLDIRLRGALG